MRRLNHLAKCPMPASLRRGGRCSTVVTRQCNTRYQCAVALRKNSVVGSEATWRGRQERGSGRQGRKKGNRRVASGEHHCDPARGKEYDNTSMSRPRKNMHVYQTPFTANVNVLMALSPWQSLVEFSSFSSKESGREKKKSQVHTEQSQESTGRCS